MMTFFISFSFANERTIGKMELVSFNLPSKPSSPRTKKSLKSTFSLFCKAISRAIGRSKWLPSFFRSEGERFTVTFCGGNLKLIEFKALLILSFDSWIEVCASPTIENDGKALTNATSTFTNFASIVSSVAQKIFFTRSLLCF